MTSSKPTVLDVGVEERASSLRTDADEPVKRRRQSKSKRAKKAAKVKGRGQSPRSSAQPEEEYGIGDLEDLIPDDQLRSTTARSGRVVSIVASRPLVSQLVLRLRMCPH